MNELLPRRVLGATQLSPSARAGFGRFLDEAEQCTLLTEGSPWVWETLRERDRLRRWAVWALVPNVAGYVREATDHGMFGAGWRRLRRMHPFSACRLCLQGLLRVRGVLRRDFPTLLTMLLELELANFRRVRPGVVFLHPQVTDLLLAMNNGAALAQAVQHLERGFGARVGLATSNAGSLLPRLQQWGVEVSCLLTPLHPCGWGMRPDRTTCERALQTFQGQVIATPEVALDDSIAAYWRELRVACGVYDVPQPNLEEWRAWERWPLPAEAAPPAAPVEDTVGKEVVCHEPR